MSYSIERTTNQKTGFASQQSFRKSHEWSSIQSDRKSNSGIPLDTEGLTVWMSNPEYHALICGASGIGKTRRVLYPAVALSARARHSMIIADMKGEIYRHTADIVKKCGLDVKVINLRTPSKGNHFNPLSLVEDYWYSGYHARATILLKDIASIVTKSILSSTDKYWQSSANDAFIGFALLILEKLDKGNLTFENIQGLFNDFMSYNSDTRSAFNFDKDSDSYKRLATILNLSVENTLSCIASEFNAALSMFTDQDDVRNLLSTSDLKLTDIGTKPTAVYLVCPDESTALYEIASLFVEQSYSELITFADNRDDNHLPVKVDYVLDEFGSFVGSDWPSKLTAARSRGIRFYLAIQAMSQLVSRYGESGARTIISNCRTLMFMGGRDIWLMNELSYLGGTITDTDSMIERPVLSITDMQNLKQGQIIILDGNNKPYIGNLPDWTVWNVKKSSSCNLESEKRKRQNIRLVNLFPEAEVEEVSDVSIDKSYLD